MKKVVSILTAVILAVVCLALPAAAAESNNFDDIINLLFGENNIKWTSEENGKVVIWTEGEGDGLMESLIFNYDGGLSPWAYDETITSVEIKEGVKSVGMYAFIGCSNLEKVTFPQSLTSIGTDAFADCTSLGQISFSGPVTFAPGAFKNCKSLTSAVMSYSENLDESFSGCANISQILYYGNQVSWKLAGGERLLSALGRDVQFSFKPFTASGTCSNREGSDVKWTVTEAGELRIYGDGSIGRSYSLSTRNLIPFGWEPYSTEVDRIVVEPGVTSIGDFSALKNVNRIYIPKTVTKIEAGCFPRADSKTTIYYAGTEAQWNQIDIDKEPSEFVRLYHGGNDGLDSCTFVYNYPVPVILNFTDVPDTLYCADSVRWAVGKAITQGTGNNEFSPNKVCNRSEILTFLWRAFDSPEASVESPYSDIHGGYGYDAYYYQAAMWAYDKGIYTGHKWSGAYGTSFLSFNAYDPCTRRDAIVYMWKAAGSPKGYSAKFTDISKSDTEAVQAVGWAAANGITAGISATEFSPNSTCTRGQIVTFLHRAFG